MKEISESKSNPSGFGDGANQSSNADTNLTNQAGNMGLSNQDSGFGGGANQSSNANINPNNQANSSGLNSQDGRISILSGEQKENSSLADRLETLRP